MYAIGHGVAVDWRLNTQGDLEINSDFVPMVEVPQVTADVSNDSQNVLSFAFLSQIETNHSVVSELKDFIFKYDLWIIKQQGFAEENDQGDDENIANRIVKKMLIAKRRMMRGINLLDNDEHLKKAFAIANEAMFIQMRRSIKKAGDDADDRTLIWRPFQLAFVLMLIESAVDEENEYRDVVDLIWFPTGGGKTEAYLGLMAFLFAYRRLRYSSSSGGTITIMRYTLRLLTTQQFERACRVISALELIRQSDEVNLGKVPFTIGLWLGGATSPNTFQQTIDKIDNKQYDQLVLTHCPWCNHKFNESNYICAEDNFHFTCLNIECDFGKKPNNVLPYNVVDEALYKNPPSLLVATVDKFARFSWEEKAARFLGDDINRPPELIIQDELHLISGALGSIVGLYEAGFETALLAKGVRAKYIASTATIKNAEQQVKSLFGREMSIFPPVGLRHTDSYFAKTIPLETKPGRLYIGYMAYGLNRVNSLVPLASLLAAAPLKLFQYDSLEMDAWWTQVIYHSSLKSLGVSRTNYQNKVLTSLNKHNELSFFEDAEREIPGILSELKKCNKAEKYIKLDQLIEENEPLKKIYSHYNPVRNLRIKTLTSNQTSQENSDVFSSLNLHYSDAGAIDVVLATNMISVGLDVSRLAVMVVNGQPQTTSEYIQASRSYCQMWCMASSSGVLFLIGNLFKSIDEFNAGYNIS